MRGIRTSHCQPRRIEPAGRDRSELRPLLSLPICVQTLDSIEDQSEDGLIPGSFTPVSLSGAPYHKCSRRFPITSWGLRTGPKHVG